jgi:internalin A
MELALKRISECKSQKNTYLDLSNCGLTYMPTEIFSMQWLKALNLGNGETKATEFTNISRSITRGLMDEIPNQIKSIDFAEMPNLETLFMNNCELSNIRQLSNLPKLRELYLQNNQIKNIEFVTTLKTVRILDLSGNPIENLKPFQRMPSQRIGNNDDTTGLVDLNLRSTGIIDIGFLKELQKLQKLNLDDNNLEVVKISGYLVFNNLVELSIRNNPLISLGDIINFKKLEKLYISHLDITKFITYATLDKLTHLYCTSTSMSDINSIKRFLNLVELNLSNNKISDISSIKELINLESLNLSSNQIEDIKPITALKKLSSIDLSNNKIAHIRPFLVMERESTANKKIEELDRLLKNIPVPPTQRQDISLNISENPISDFPNSRLLSVRTVSDIKNYYQDSIQKRNIPNREVKLILTGNSATGKTTLTKILRGLGFDETQDTTDGMSIERWQTPDGLVINFWDFGGQEYYHGTQHLFFNSNAVYLLLWNRLTNGYDRLETSLNRGGKAVKEIVEHFNYTYWLDNIRSFSIARQKNTEGVDNGGGDILIIQNRIDEIGNEKQNVPQEIMSKYQIAADYYLSLKPAPEKVKRFEHLLEVFREELLERLHKNVETEFFSAVEDKMRQWFLGVLAKNATSNPLKKHLKHKCYILFDDLIKVCKLEFGLLERPSIESFIASLHDAGALLYYRDHPSLRDKIFVNPYLITELIYKVLDDETIRKTQQGVFEPQHITTSLGEKHTDFSKDLTNLMERFGIITPLYENPNQTAPTKYIAPQYLPPQSEMGDLFRIATTGLAKNTLKIR